SPSLSPRSSCSLLPRLVRLETEHDDAARRHDSNDWHGTVDGDRGHGPNGNHGGQRVSEVPSRESPYAPGQDRALRERQLGASHRDERAADNFVTLVLPPMGWSFAYTSSGKPTRPLRPVVPTGRPSARGLSRGPRKGDL